MVTRSGSTVIVALAGVGDSSAGAGRPRRTFLTNVSNGPSAGGKEIWGSSTICGEKGGGKKNSAEKTKSRTFPLRFEIPQKPRDFHFSHRPSNNESVSAFTLK